MTARLTIKTVPLLFMLFVFSVAPSTTSSQPLPEAGGTEDGVSDAVSDFLKKQESRYRAFTISILIKPQTPGPGGVVRAVAQGFGRNLSEEIIVWYKNGKEVFRGRGETTYDLTAGALGSETTITASVIFPDGVVRSATETVRPSVVHLIWEAKTQVPPWYKGKAVPSPGSNIVVEAIPKLFFNGSPLDPDNLNYTWKINNQTQIHASGKGKHAIRFRADNIVGAVKNISLTVSSATGVVSANGSISIPVYRPKVLLYKEEPLIGAKNENALNTITVVSGEDALLRAEPFFFNKGAANNLEYTWRVNNDIVTGSQRSSPVLTLKTESGVSGEQGINVSVKNPENTFQTTNTLINAYVE